MIIAFHRPDDFAPAQDFNQNSSNNKIDTTEEKKKSPVSQQNKSHSKVLQKVDLNKSYNILVFYFDVSEKIGLQFSLL